MSLPVGMGRVGTHVNKFEQVSCDDHQMSVAGSRYAGPMPGG